ncbi:MAG: bifunctional demethylmenaquinone methyltransferase/2-methoxy-6-polyprenyl-1,4-benzoquinol methylase UbiE [Planctomycetota bacterium]
MTPRQAAISSGDTKRKFVSALFDRIASRYDLANDIITLCSIDRWRRNALRDLDIPEGAVLLDVGTGTGKIPEYLAQHRPDLKITGIDISREMLAIASRKNQKANFLYADATMLPFEDESFDCVVSAFVFRNLQDRPAALKEMFRVLRPGGDVILLDTFFPRKGNLWRVPMRLWLRHIAPVLVAPFSGFSDYRYLAESILEMNDWDAVVRMFEDAGFQSVSIKALSMGTVARIRGTKQH